MTNFIRINRSTMNTGLDYGARQTGKTTRLLNYAHSIAIGSQKSVSIISASSIRSRHALDTYRQQHLLDQSPLVTFHGSIDDAVRHGGSAILSGFFMLDEPRQMTICPTSKHCVLSAFMPNYANLRILHIAIDFNSISWKTTVKTSEDIRYSYEAPNVYTPPERHPFAREDEAQFTTQTTGDATLEDVSARDWLRPGAIEAAAEQSRAERESMVQDMVRNMRHNLDHVAPNIETGRESPFGSTPDLRRRSLFDVRGIAGSPMDGARIDRHTGTNEPFLQYVNGEPRMTYRE